MPSYSVNLNAVVAQAATAVTRLQVVCSYGGSESQVCVANTSNLAAAGGKLRGVALENAAAGFPIQIIDFGSVDNPGMVGSGAYVAYDVNGNLVRQAQLTAQVVGTYENGVIHVNLGYAALAAAAGVTWLVVTDPAFGAIGDGTTDDTAAFVAAIAAKESLGSTCRIYVPPGRYKLTSAIDLGTAGFTLEGDGYNYAHQNLFGDAAWANPAFGTGVTGSVLYWPNATDGLKITSYPSAGIHIKDIALVGPGTGTTTGLYEASPTSVVNVVGDNVLIANWGRGLAIGGVEQGRFHGFRIWGCVYGLTAVGTPALTGGSTSSTVSGVSIQTCTVGAYITNVYGFVLDGEGGVIQSNGKSLNITGATNASPIVLTVSSTVGLETGMKVDVSGVGGNTAANVTDTAITVIDSTHLSLNGTTGSGAYTTGGTLTAGFGILVQPDTPAGYNSCNHLTIRGIHFENNKRAIRFDCSATSSAVGSCYIDECILAYATDSLTFSSFGAGAAVNRLIISRCKTGTDLVVPAASVYGSDTDCAWNSFTNGNPANWKHDDASAGTALQIPAVASNGAVTTGSYFGYSGGTLPNSGIYRAPLNTSVVVVRSSSGGDLKAMWTDGTNDLFLGNTTGWAASFLLGPSVYLGNAGSLFAMQLAASVEYHSLPSLGGDGTGSTPNGPHSSHGFATSALGDSDQTVAAAQYSRECCEFTGAWTAARKRTFPTPASANAYYEKTIINNTTGGFAVTVSCGAGTTVSVAAGKTARVGFKSTGDCIRVTADV